MRLSAIITGAILFLISGCSQVPHEGSHTLSYQKILQSSDHWKKFAENISNEVRSKLKKESEVDRITGKIGMSKESGHIDPDSYYKNSYTQVCISDKDRSDFGSSMQTFLKQSLYNKGLSVHCSNSTPYIIDWEVSIVKFDSERIDDGKGLLQFIAELPVYILLGGADYYINKPHTEIIVTYYLKNKYADNVMMHNSSIFYINDEDVHQYAIVDNNNKIQGVTSSKKFYVTNK